VKELVCRAGHRSSAGIIPARQPVIPGDQEVHLTWSAVSQRTSDNGLEPDLRWRKMFRCFYAEMAFLMFAAG